MSEVVRQLSWDDLRIIKTLSECGNRADTAKKLGVKPEDSDTSRALKKGAAENVANLKKLKGAQFDKAYVDHEVAYHQQVLDAIDKVLVPNAQNAELKDLIVKVRPAIATHLKHAKHIQASLEKK